MKTAISLPDATARRVDQRAAELGVSRSEFFATAAERYLADLDASTLTARVDAALDDIGLDVSWRVAAEAGRQSLLLSDGDDW